MRRMRTVFVTSILLLTLGTAPQVHADDSVGKGQGESEATAVAAIVCGTRPYDKDPRPYGKFFDRNGVNIRTGPKTSCPSRGLGYRSDDVDYHCYDSGQTVNGISTWTYLRDVRTEVTGWVSDSLLALNSFSRGSVVHC